jgi:hypothetical protein
MPLDRDLAPGADGAPVTELHAALLRLGETPWLAAALAEPAIARAFAKERAQARYADATEKLISILQERLGLPDDGKLDAATRKAINALMADTAPGPKDPAPAEGQVSGRVLGPRGAGLDEVPVLLERLRAGGKAEILAEGVSGPGGAYALRYPRAGEGAFHLRVGAGTGAAAHRAPALLNAPRLVAGFDVLMPKEEGGTDFDRVRRLVTAAAERAGLAPAQLEEKPEQPDVSLIAAETGLTARRVALFAAAARMEAGSDGAIAAELVYGLASEGVAFGAAALLRVPHAAIEERLRLAVERHSVSQEVFAQLKVALAHAAAVRRAAEKEAALETPIGGILAAAVGEAPARRFLDLAIKATDAEAVWAAARADQTLAPVAEELRFTIEVTALVGAQPAAVGMLRGLRESGAIKDVTNLADWTVGRWEKELAKAKVEPPGLPDDADEAMREAARRDHARGLDRVMEATQPRPYLRARLAASDLAERGRLVAFLDAAKDFSLTGSPAAPYLRAHPGLAQQLGADGAEQLGELTRVARVARRAEPSIALVGAGLGSAQAIAAQGPRAFARAHGESFGSATLALEAHARAGQSATMAAELLLEATPQQGPQFNVIPLSGAVTMPAFPDWASLFGAADGCACAHCGSVTSPGAYLVDVLQFLRHRQPLAGATPLAVLRRPGRRPDIAQIELTCENSDTVLPYIDLVNEILEDAVAPPPAFTPANLAGPVATRPGGTVIDPAFRDQVNQALGLTGAQVGFAIAADATITSLGEGGVAAGAPASWRIEDSFATYGLRLEAGQLRVLTRARNTRGPAAERLVSPQYVNQSAYGRLAGATYPLTLPFLRPLAEARIGLEARGSTLAELRLALTPGTPEARRRSAAVAQERLRLSPVDAALVTWTQPAAGPALTLNEPWRHWGFTATTASAANPLPDPENATTPITVGDWAALLAGRLDLLMDRGQFSVDQVLDLLDTRYVNPPSGARRTIELVSTLATDPATCRTRLLALRGLDVAGLIRILRIARLSLRSGLSLREIDEALHALGAAAPDAAFLVELAQLVALRERLGCDWSALCAAFVPPANARLAEVWSPAGALRRMDRAGGETRAAASLYEALFRPASNPAPGLSWFPRSPDALAGLDLQAGLNGLAAAFGLPAADMAALLASPLVVADTAATLPNLARLHRHALIAARSGLAVGEYLLAVARLGPDPFAAPAALGDFLAALDRLAASRILPEELDAMVGGGSATAEPARIEQDTALLEQLRAALRQIAAEHRFIPAEAEGEAPTRDPDGQLLQDRLGAIGMPAPLARAAVEALSDTAMREVTDPALPLVAITLPRVEAPLAALPAGVAPDALTEGRAGYDAARGQLFATALLNEADRLVLAGASADAAYRGALAQLCGQQDALAGRASFDAVARRLRFTGLMPAAWRTQLDGLSANPAWRAAVRQLHDAPRRVLRLLLRGAALPQTATLLPNGLPIRLPPAMAGRLVFDNAVNPAQLRLSGALLPPEVLALQAAAPGTDAASAGFRAALDTLAAAAEAAPITAADRLFADAALEALMDAAAPAEERHLAVLRAILPRAADRRARAALGSLLGSALGVPAAVAMRLAEFEVTLPGGGPSAAALLRDPPFLYSPPALRPNMQAFRSQHLALRLLRHGALLAQRHALTEADFALLVQVADWPRLASLPAEPLAAGVAPPVPAAQLLRFADHRRLRDAMPGGSPALAALAAARQGGATGPAMAVLLAERLGRPAAQVTQVAALLGVTLPGDLAGERGLLRLLDGFALLDQLGLSPATAVALAQPTIAADAGRAAITSYGQGMGAAAWAEAGRAMFDRIRMAARDALVAYLLARGRPAEAGLPAARWRGTGELFGHFLIDVDMGACMETSRLRQAMSSVQLFVQRCQLGLEPEVRADAEADDGWLQWSWMRSYRVWEANRKVFLWPENLLTPELMDMKSPLLRELEGELGQGDVTMEGAARAMLGYLEKLRPLAKLTPLTTAREAVRGGTVLHVVAATDGEPASLYHRRRSPTRIWSPWERMDVEVSTPHVLLHVWDGRPFLFWLGFTARATNPSLNGNQVRAQHLFDVKLNWSELRDGAWTAQRQSRSTLVLLQEQAGEDLRGVLFRVQQQADGSLSLRWRHTGGNGAPMTAAGLRRGFTIAYPHAEPELEQLAAFRLPGPLPRASHALSGQVLTGSWQTPRVLELPHRDGAPEPALTMIRGRIDITGSGAWEDRALEEGPFLLRDRRRVFLVAPNVHWEAARATPTYILPNDFDIWIEPERRKPPIRWLPEVELGLPTGPGWGGPGGPRPYKMAFDDGPERWAETNRLTALISREFKREARRALSIGEDAGTMLRENEETMPSPMQPEGTMPLLLRSSGKALKLAGSAIAYGGDTEAVAILDHVTWSGTGAQFKPGYGLFLETVEIRRYRFEPFHHPHVDTLLHVLRHNGLEAMLARDVQLRPHVHQARPLAAPVGYAATYGSVPDVVEWQHGADTLDFDYDGAYSVYNWELFFHIPLLIADRLAKSQRFEDARRWMHLIFDPTDQTTFVTEEDGTQWLSGTARFWRTKPFFRNSRPSPGGGDSTVERERIERILLVLAAGAAPDANQRLTPQDRDDLVRFQAQVEEMRRNPFRPHAIARLRSSAYQRAVVMRYLEILVEWGDQLFRRDTMETINAATQLYVLAADLRGGSGAVMPPRATALPQSYASLEGRLDGTSNALVAIESYVTPSGAPTGGGGAPAPAPAMLAFCVPRNARLDAVWETIADRLFKIRNCLNIDGVRRRLALFDPPIDPALLARAVAAGVDVGAALADLDGPSPTRRFRMVIRQAAELAAEARALGAALLSALEKRDNEELQRLRVLHERRVLERGEAVRKLALEESDAALTALRASRLTPLQRLRHHARLLGNTNGAAEIEGKSIPLLPPRPDTATRSANGFALLAALASAAPAAGDMAEGLANIPVNAYEEMELAQMTMAQGLQLASSIYEVISGVANYIPNFNLEPWGIGGTYGGANVGAAFSAIASGFRGASGAAGFAASMAGRAAQYASRAEEWGLQHNLAASEIMQIDRQLLAAQLRRRMAERELENHRRQIEEAAEHEEALLGRFTGLELQNWMIGRLSALYFETHRLAHDLAKRAQQSARHELQQPQLDHIRFGHWDGLKRGLLAADSLALDIRRLEAAYEELDTREEAMVKHVSLARLDPAALARLRETGSATFAVPEALFDLDAPGQYLRRLRGVSLTIPCVAGPYAGVHARLTLLRSTIRHSPALAGRGRAYARDRLREDGRFRDLPGRGEAIVTSGAQSDSGLFDQPGETRSYLPFEGMGAVSEWRIELPAAFRGFDHASIADVILHLRYSARFGGDALRGAVQTELRDALNLIETANEGGGMVRRFSLRHEAPAAWQRMLELPDQGFHVADLPITRERLPFFVEGRRVSVRGIAVLLRLRPEFMADLRMALGGDLTPLGGGAATAFDLRPWSGRVLRADWSGDMNIDPPAGPAAAPWRLRLRRNQPAPALIPAGAWEDVELLVRYALT